MAGRDLCVAHFGVEGPPLRTCYSAFGLSGFIPPPKCSPKGCCSSLEKQLWLFPELLVFSVSGEPWTPADWGF